MATPDLSICIVTWNSLGVLPALLESLPAAVDGLSYELIITDNASSDAIVEYVAEHCPQADFVRNDENRYFTYATNQNLKRARGRFVASINPDGVMGPSSLARMVRVMTEQPDIGVITPRFFKPDGSDRVSFGRFMSRKWFVYEGLGINALLPNNAENRAVYPPTLNYDPALPQDADVLYGACLVIRREVLEQVGFNDEALVHGFDEYDFCRRVRQAGWRLRYEPSATMVHIEGASRALVITPEARARLKGFHYAGMKHLCRKHYGRGAGMMYELFWVTVGRTLAVGRSVVTQPRRMMDKALHAVGLSKRQAARAS